MYTIIIYAKYNQCDLSNNQKTVVPCLEYIMFNMCVGEVC